MRRLHLFDFEDLDRMSRPIRAGGTDLRDFWFDRLGFKDRVAPNVLMLLETTRASGVVDLCSVGGGLRGRCDTRGAPETQLRSSYRIAIRTRQRWRGSTRSAIQPRAIAPGRSMP